MVSLTLPASFVLALLPAAVLGYQISADVLNCRASASTTATVIRQYRRGDNVDVVCQTTGPLVETTSIWDKTQHACFVSDYYVETGYPAYIPGVPLCGTSSSGACTGVNAATLSLIKSFEGFVPSPAPDPIGLPTVGYGHLCQTSGCSEAGPFPLTEARATALLNADIPRYTRCLADYISNTVILNDNQFGALASWTFNVGCGNVQTSTLVSRLNGGQNPNTVAAEELPRWNKAGGSVLPGLTRRRAAEVTLFQTGSSRQAHPSCQ